MGARENGLWLSAVVVAALLVGIFLLTRYLRVPANVAYVTEEEGGISVIDLSTLKVIRRVRPNNVAPRGLAVTFDGKYLITSNKDTSDVAVFSTPHLHLVKRIHIGHSPEFIKINPAGDRLFATFEPGTKADLRKPPGPRVTVTMKMSRPRRLLHSKSEIGLRDRFRLQVRKRKASNSRATGS